MTEPVNVPEGKIFSVFLAEIPKYPVLMNLQLMENFNGTLTPIVSLKHPGGLIGIPYIIDENAQVELYVDGEHYEQQYLAVYYNSYSHFELKIKAEYLKFIHLNIKYTFITVIMRIANRDKNII